MIHERDVREQPIQVEVDVKALMKSLTQQELLSAAEAYFATIEDPTFHLSKPFASVDDCPVLLANFAKLLRDGEFLSGHRVLEFGAGSCWAGRLLNQLGMAVTSLDVAPSAIALGERLKHEQPVFGTQPQHSFMQYDGLRIPLPDRSMDRVFCFDAFHHVVNPEHTLLEMARVLDRGGIAAFSEPGPRHSLTVESQREMRQHKVIENDVVIEDLWEAAQAAGFTDIYFSVQTETTLRLGYDAFREFRQTGIDDNTASELRRRIVERNRNTTFFYLVNGVPIQADSRTREGLIADLRLEQIERKSGPDAAEYLRVTMSVRNTSTRTWRRSGLAHGCVNVGVHLLDGMGNTLKNDYFRHGLLDADLPPQQVVTTTFDVSVPCGIDDAVIEFDLVSEGVCWFAQNGSKTDRVRL